MSTSNLKKQTSFLFFFFTFFFNSCYSQQVIDLFTVWSGSSTTDHVIWQPAFESGKGWYGAIYSKQEMTKNGLYPGQNDLSSLRWNLQYDLQGAGQTRIFKGVKIYLYHSSTPYFTSINKPTLPPNAVEVFSGDLSFKIPFSYQSVCETYVKFASKFQYDGTSSLVVYIEKTSPQSAQPTDPYFALLNDSDQTHIRNIGSYKGNNTSDYANTKKYKYPQIKFNDNTTTDCLNSVCPNTITYSKSSFCQSETNPKPNSMTPVGGVLSVTPASKLIMSNDGTIDLAQSVPGTYTISYTANGCSSDFSLTVKASPSKPSAPSAQYFCAIKKPVISDLAATASGSASLKWFTKSSSTELSPSLPLVNGNKYYTRSYEGGCLSKDSVEVLVSLGDTTAPTYTKQPTVNPITLEFCSSSKLTLDSLNKSVVGNLKKWYDGTTLLTDMSQLLTSKTYTVSQTNSKGCESTLTLSIKVTINVTPSNPTVSPVDQTFCSAENPKIASLIPSLIVDPTLKWYDKNGVLKLKDDLLVNGSIYYATKKDVLNGCESPKSETAKVTVKIVSSPAQATLKDTTICFSAQASLKAVGESSGIFKWFSSEIGGTLLKTGIKLDTTLSLTSSFYVSQSLGSCESARKKVTVFVTPKLIIPSISNQNQSFCEKNNPIVSDLLPKGDTIQWYLKSTGLKVSKKDKLLNSSQYIVSLVKGECESEKSALSVTVKLMPRLKVLSSQPSSCGLKDGSITISSPSLNLNGSLVLSKDSINTIPLVNLPSYTLSGLKAGSYQLSYNNNVCVFDTLISLNDPGSPVKPILSPSGATKFCNGNKVKVTYTNPTGDPFYWHDGSTNTTIDVTKKSVCYVVVTNALGCKSTSSITDVDVITFPTVTKLTGNVDSLFYCSSDGKMIKDLPYAPYSPQTIEWFDGNKKITSPNDKLASGFYYCAEKELNSGLFCINDKRDTVYVTLNTMHVDIAVQQSVCGQNNGKISLKITGTPGLKYDYSWRKDGSILTETTQSIGNISEGSYKVTIKSKGCILQDSLILLVCKDPIIPQILTPDGNLKNDLWEIGFKYKYPNVTVEIYNRWGNLVYKSEKPYNDNWDGKPNVAGTIGNETLPSGTYYYIIDKGNNESIEKGYLELIK